MIVFEDRIKYDLWLQILLIFAILVPVVIGLIFYVDSHSRDILPGETARESRLGSLIIFAAAGFELLIYWAFLPRKITISSHRVRLKYGFFHHSIPFSSIRSGSLARGISLGSYISLLTSFKNQIEIQRKKGKHIRFSPADVDGFLASLNSARATWSRMAEPDKIR